jgi:outer membrane autotransporter protein
MATRSPGSRRLPQRPTTRAIRVALLASSTFFALAGSSVALAQSCVQTDPLEVTCTGTFTDSVNTHIPLVNQVPDLTIIVGEAPATTVTPGTGVVGLNASYGGTMTVLSDADFTTLNADGITIFGTNDAVLTSYGDINTSAVLAGANALDLSAGNDVDATIGGYTTTTASANLAAVAVRAAATAGYIYVDVTDTGMIAAYADTGNAVALATYSGKYADAQLIDNAGTIYAYSYAGSAVGVDAALSKYGDATITNTGDIAAVVGSGAGAATGLDVFLGAGITPQAGLIDITNDGSITGTVLAGGTGDAYGVIATGFGGDVLLTNTEYGVIGATADTGAATAVTLSSTLGDVTLDNYGEIYAYTADGTLATAVDLYVGAGGTATLNNAGTITGDVVFSGVGNAVVYTGDLYGNLVLGVGDDYILVDGTFEGDISTGAGDDAIVNTGTIILDGNTIDLGDPGVAGNSFDNEGDILVNGDSVVDMGLANPLAFCNTGTIDMRDGAANDSFTIIGDLACDGALGVDVAPGATIGAADMLYVDGDVAADSVTGVYVDLVGEIGDTIDTLIPIIEVTGTSVAGNFELADVDWDEEDSFVTADFGLVADIDATNATPDVFSLAIDVTGLSDTGTLAAAVTPGVIDLVNAQVGTLKQRMGVLDEGYGSGLTLWARVFGNKTDFRPDHDTDDFGLGGNFDWNQRNRGIEAGADFGVGDAFHLGLMVGKSKSDIDLTDGVGETEIDANSWGIYGLYFQPGGFYADLSYRWVKFDVELDSIAGRFDTDGKAQVFNAEVGYAFRTASGFTIEPQLQYTKTNVDDDMDAFVSDSGMVFRTDGGDSSRARAGVAFYKDLGDADTGWSTTPYLVLSAVRELDGETRYAVNDALFGRSTVEGTSGMVELGFTARNQGLALYGGLTWQDGGAIDSSFGGHLGVRYTFGGTTPAPAPVVIAAPAKTCADLDDDSDGVNNCDDKCPGTVAGTAVGMDGCPVPAPQPEPEPEMAPKPYRG